MIPRKTYLVNDEKPSYWNSGIVEFKGKYLFIGNTGDDNIKSYGFVNPDFTPFTQPILFTSRRQFDFRLIKAGGEYFAVFFTKFAAYRGSVVLQRFVINDNFTITWTRDRYQFDEILDWPGYQKQHAEKNWMPFVHNDEIYFVYSVLPHVILRFNQKLGKVQKVYDEHWVPEGWERVRNGMFGNANCARVGDYHLGTFHSKPTRQYWTGYYFFEAKPPFRPKLIGTQEIFAPHYSTETRKSARIAKAFDNVMFPIGTLPVGDKLLMSYGENDTLQRVAEFTQHDLLLNTHRVK